MLVGIVVALVLVLIVRIWQVLPSKTRSSSKIKGKVRACVVLGSGGHTTEMCALLNSMDQNLYNFEFVLAETDQKSEDQVKTRLTLPAYPFIKIPRSREVHQSLFTSVFTTLYAMLVTCYKLLFRAPSNWPDLILCNGPGTCVPICLIFYIPRILGLKHIKMIYVESVCRVTSLSFTGRILYRLMDRFVVQWPELAQKYARCEYLGARLC